MEEEEEEKEEEKEEEEGKVEEEDKEEEEEKEGQEEKVERRMGGGDGKIEKGTEFMFSYKKYLIINISWKIINGLYRPHTDTTDL